MKPIRPLLNEMEMSSRHAPMTGKEQLKLAWEFQKYLLPFWDKLLLGVILSFVVSFAGMLYVPFYRLLLDVAIPQKDYSFFWMWIINMVLFGYGWQYGLVNFVTGLTSVLCDWYVKMTLGYRLRLMYYRHLHSLSMRFFDRRPIGEHMYRVGTDAASAVDLVLKPIPWFMNLVAGSTLTIGIAFTQLPKWVIVAEYAYMIVFWATIHWTRSVSRRILHTNNELSQAITAEVQDGLAGFQTIKAYGRQRREVGRFIRVLAAQLRQEMKIFCWSFAQAHIVSPRFPSLSWIHVTVVALSTQILIINHQMTLGEQMVFASYLSWLAGPFQGFFDLFQETRIMLVSAERFRDTMGVRPAVQESKQARRVRVKGNVVFENVSFVYEDKAVLEDFSLEIPAGASVGIVGPSGAGKSTLLSLLLRLYDPTSGRVLVDGHDLRDVRLEDYHHQVGPVLQDTFLFQGSIRDNLLFAKPRATDAEIMDVLERAEVADFVRQLPEGLDTDLSEGSRVSGGQKQRIGIARTLLRDPRMMILDEPTSALDVPTETAIVKTLQSVIRGRTAFFVSHRLGLVMGCDMIVVMEGGKLVAKGTHSELLRECALYRRLWNEQYGGEESAAGAGEGDEQAI